MFDCKYIYSSTGTWKQINVIFMIECTHKYLMVNTARTYQVCENTGTVAVTKTRA